jgi:hypothetical protein
MQPKLIPLETLLRWLWEDNPKLHQDVLIQHSIVEYGFNDRVGVCSKFMLVLEGHGRLGNLKRLKDLVNQGDANAKMPLNIQPDPVLGDWLIPCDDHDQFETREQAYQYALMHNRSGVAALDLRDYDVSKLQKAISKASAGQQMGFELLGFGTNDFATSSVTQPGVVQGAVQKMEQAAQSTTGVAQLPSTATFNPDSLANAPAYQNNQAPVSYVIMITALDQGMLLRMLTALTFGERKSAPDGARFVSVDGAKYLQEWERLLVAKETSGINAIPSHTQPLPGQITFAGMTVTDPRLPPDTILMTGADGQVVEKIANVVTLLPEPQWDVDGNCPACNGKGYTGLYTVGDTSHKAYCTVCNASGTKSVWDESRR